MTLCLPRDEMSVPVVRRVLKASLQTLGVDGEVISDIEVALTEAVTNVLDHSTHGEEYEVSVGIDGAVCTIEVIDRGSGFDSNALGRGDADVSAEEGRGIQLMRALVDRVTFDHVPTVGTVVHLEKRLDWAPDSPAARLTAANPKADRWGNDEKSSSKGDDAQVRGVSPLG